MNNLVISLILIVIAQSLTYLQLQSQFFSDWAKQHPAFIAFLGFPISYVFIKFTQYCAAYFDGQTWPGRLIGFAIGAIVFAVLSKLLMNESITLKTLICLILASGILLVQLFWK